MKEGVDDQKIFRVGNVMIDTLVRLLPEAKAAPVQSGTDGPYVLVTLHRPSNVDEPEALGRILEALNELSREVPIVFPVHPRTRARMNEIGWSPEPGMSLIDPIGYIECLALQTRATLIITDSGGIQEESTFLRVPCITMRKNTERPVTVSVGTNVLVGDDVKRMLDAARRVLRGRAPKGQVPPLWDGQAARRIADVVMAIQVEREAQLTEMVG